MNFDILFLSLQLGAFAVLERDALLPTITVLLQIFLFHQRVSYSLQSLRQYHFIVWTQVSLTTLAATTTVIDAVAEERARTALIAGLVGSICVYV